MSIYVARIPPECNEAALRDIFDPIGPIKSISLKSSKGDHKTNYAFIDFINDNDAVDAVKYMNNYQCGDYKLLVNSRKKEGSTSGNEMSASGFGGFKSITEKSRSTSVRGRGGFGSRGGGGMRNTGFVSITSQSDDNLFRNGSSNSSIDDVWDDSSDMESKNIQISNVNPVKETNSEEKVLVIHIEDPSKFWGQAISQNNANDINLIASELARECRHGVKVKDESLSEKIYGCKFSCDDQWYRCKTEKYFSEAGVPKVKVRYIDYGNYEVVPESSLVELPISLQQKQPCAKEYKMDIDPINSDENSDIFKKGTEHLQNLLNEQVVNIITQYGFNPSVKVTLTSSKKDVAEEMISAGFVVAALKQKPDGTKPGNGLKQLQPLRSPRNTIFPSTNGQSGQQVMEDSKMKIASLQSELQNHKLVAEKLKMEVEMLKQKNTHLEQLLVKADTKVKELSNSGVNARLIKLTEEISSLKELRSEMCIEETLNPVLKNAIASLTEGGKSIQLKNIKTFSKLLDAESKLSAHQDMIRNCNIKDDVADLIRQRDESRKEFYDKLNAFLNSINELDFSSRKKELELLLSQIKLNYEVPTNLPCSGLGIIDAVQAYDNWRAMKVDDVREMQQNADLCSLTITNNLEIIKQKLSLKDEAVFFEVEDTVSECQNMDELLENCSRAVTNEISTIKETNIDKECNKMISNLVSSIVHSINDELDDIQTLRDKLRVEYMQKKDDVEVWLNNKPDTSKLKEIRSQLKNLKSKFRHKQADRKDLEEDSEEDDQLQKIEIEIESMRNTLHKLFIKETKLLGQLSQISKFHFPELNILQPDLGISTFLESKGILHTRELEYYDHHFLPLISSASSQPLVYKTRFNQEDCVLKEYSLGPQLTKEVIKKRIFKFAICQHPNLAKMDSLFFDKPGRKAYLQTPYYSDENFKDFLETKPHLEGLIDLFHGLLQAVDVLHSNGCVHGGISLRNVLIKRENGDAIAVLREPDFSKNENQRFEELAASHSVLNTRMESPSKGLDMFYFGLLMFSVYFPDQAYDRNVLKDSKENPIYYIIRALLDENAEKRMSASEAVNHPTFHIEIKKPASPSEELISTMKDLSDSFAIVELNESTEHRELRDNTPGDDDDDATSELKQENAELRTKDDANFDIKDELLIEE